MKDGTIGEDEKRIMDVLSSGFTGSHDVLAAQLHAADVADRGFAAGWWIDLRIPSHVERLAEQKDIDLLGQGSMSGVPCTFNLAIRNGAVAYVECTTIDGELPRHATLDGIEFWTELDGKSKD